MSRDTEILDASWFSPRSGDLSLARSFKAGIRPAHQTFVASATAENTHSTVADATLAWIIASIPAFKGRAKFTRRSATKQNFLTTLIDFLGKTHQVTFRSFMRTPLLITTLLLIAGFGSTAKAQKCLGYGPTVSLTGTIRSQVFPGPPNYESIKSGDRKETATILKLTAPTCTIGNDPPDLAETGLREMQLVVRKSADWETIRRRRGKRVIVSGTLFHAITGHHRTKVLIDVANIRAPT
jgi:hypothetical protein